MRYSEDHKQQTRARIVEAAGQLFRREGYGGGGIDELTKAAGVTNGAFYGHFKSKSEAFRVAVVAGVEELRLGVAQQKAAGRNWLRAFVDYYLGPKLDCELGESCGLASLSADVMRAEIRTRSAYEAELRKLIDEVASGLAGSGRDERAIAILALLSGGVTMARAVPDEAMQKKIVKAVTRAAASMEARDPAPR